MINILMRKRCPTNLATNLQRPKVAPKKARPSKTGLAGRVPPFAKYILGSKGLNCSGIGANTVNEGRRKTPRPDSPEQAKVGKNYANPGQQR